jgi:hypothetical protein
MDKKETLTLDRIEGTIAIFERATAEENTQPSFIELPSSWFDAPQEGMQLELSLGSTITMTLLSSESPSTLTEAEARLERLRARDNGADIIDL